MECRPLKTLGSILVIILYMQYLLNQFTESIIEMIKTYVIVHRVESECKAIVANDSAFFNVTVAKRELRQVIILTMVWSRSLHYPKLT